MFWQTRSSYEFGPFRVEPRERRLLRAGEVVPLRPKVFDVLLVLVRNSGHILSKDELMKLVWPNVAVEEGNLARSVSTLRSALGETRHEQTYIETIPWLGYRFVASVKEVPDEARRPTIDSIAVLPFVNVANDAELDYLSDGITDSLINSLSRLTTLKVMSRNSTFRYKGREAQARTVGRELNVEIVLCGRVVKHKDMLSVSVELIDARDESHVWGAQHVRRANEIFALQELIAGEIAAQLCVQLTDEDTQRLSRRHTPNTEAYHHYLKGRYYFNKLTFEGVQKAIDHLEQAVSKDGNYALAYAALGDAFNYIAKPTEASQAMTEALELDPMLGEAHASLAFWKFVYDWDFEGAEKEFAQALQQCPNYAEVHHWAAVYFANIGAHERAAVEAKRAVELDPLSLLMNMTPGLTAYLARDFDRAITELQKVIEMDPNFPAAHSVIAGVYVQQGMYKQAIAEYQKVLDQSKGVTVVERAISALMAHAYAKWEKPGKARKLLEELLKACETSNTLPVSSHAIAEIYVALGQTDAAFEWLNKALEQHDVQMVSIKVNPTLDRLRGDSRFQTLVEKVGIST